ncbi:MAG: DUF4157 domain-containing protein [Alphaproteobacteria bacterium]|nr:DUF4157 domain-containing protein [Alphaproteobacteria bacterium]MBV9371595.1 DUF4157 domain-containing protein [Alphaproteobacteria bacterium]MBV9902204.1 DUF4157 domain-containing protein [Alphaproteobacteria bacterium]
MAGGFAEAAVGAVVGAAARAVAAIQTSLRLQPRPRPLGPAERAVLEGVFRGSVDLSRVRIVAGRAGLFSLSGRPFTLGYHIYMKGFDPERHLDVLVHECCHVWQHQREGTRYIGGALIAQLTQGKAAYDWQAARRSGKAWHQLNREAQAQLVQDLFRAKGGALLGDAPTSPAQPLAGEGEALAAFAMECLDFVRRH